MCWTRGRGGTTSGRCCGGSTRTRWSGGRCWRSRGRSSRTGSSRRRCTCWGRTRGGGTRRFSTGTGRSLLSDDGCDGGVDAGQGGGDGGGGGPRGDGGRGGPGGGGGGGA